MMSLFQLSSNDQSIYFLSQIFGVVGDLLPSDRPTLIFGILFKTFNAFILTIGAFVVIYVTVLGLLKTAQEGEFLGKNWDSLWVPLRTVFGIAALFPMSSGYCAMQVLFMWVVVQGVGAADVLWTKVLGYTAVVGNPTTQTATPNTDTVYSNMGLLFQSLVCQASTHQQLAKSDPSYPAIIPNDYAQNIVPTVQYYCTTHAGEAFCKATMSTLLTLSTDHNVNNYSMGPSDHDCGQLTYCSFSASDTDPTSVDNVLCTAQRSALAGIVPVLGAIAQQFVSVDNDVLRLYTPKSYNKKPNGDDCTTSTDTSTCTLNYVVGGWFQDMCSTRASKDYTSNASNCCFHDSPVDNYDPTKKVDGKMCRLNYSLGDARNLPNDSTGSDPGNGFIGKIALPAMQFFLGNSNLNFITAATGEYTAAMMAAQANIAAQKINTSDLSNSDPVFQALLQGAQRNGWILAGSYFFDMANANKGAFQSIEDYFIGNKVFTVGNVGTIDTRHNYDAAGALIADIKNYINKNATGGFGGGGVSFGGGSSSVPGFSTITDKLGEMQNSLLNTFIANLGGNLGGDTTQNTRSQLQNSNPMPKLAAFGYAMIGLVKALFAAVLVIVPVVAGLSSINFMGLGTGFTQNPFYAAFEALLSILSPFLLLLVSGLWSLGMILGIYVPLIPYIIFASAAIGWFIATIEAIVAAPIVALGMLSPGGHELLGKAEPALGYMLGLFLRPALMILGLMAGSLLVGVAISLVNAGFLHVIASIHATPGLFEQIAYIGVYTSFVVTIVSKSFSLIYTIPDRLLLWMGLNHAAQYGGEVAGEALSVAKGSVEGIASATGKAGTEGTTKGILSAEGADEKAQKRKDRKKKPSEPGAQNPE